MVLGIYPIYLESVSTLFLPVLIPIGIGIALGGFCFMKLTKYLLEHFYGFTFYAILGFTTGSIFVLFPSVSSPLELTLSVLCTIFGFIIVSIFEKTAFSKSNKIKK